MGYMRHHAIIATTWSTERAEAVYEKALTMFHPGQVARTDSVVNVERTVFIGPDGSKEGWDESDKGDALRAEFIAWLEAEYREPLDGGSYVKWCVVQYGDDEGINLMLRHDDEARAALGDTPEQPKETP